MRRTSRNLTKKNRSCVLENLEGRVQLSAAALDLAFGNGGIARVDFQTASSDLLGDVIVLRSGKILAGGIGSEVESSSQSDSTLARYDSDGSLDPTFLNGGKVGFQGLALINVLLEQSDGKVLVGGGGGVQYRLARVNPDGTIDRTFGTNGSATGSSFSVIQDMQLTAEGKIVAVCTSGSNMAVLRFLPNGQLDPSFSEDGVQTLSLGPSSSSEENFRALLVQPDGRIVVGGMTRSASGQAAQFALVRFNPDGTQDTGFGAGGKAVIPSLSRVEKLAFAPDGKILASAGGSNRFNVVRLLADGTADATFGSQGVVAVPMTGTAVTPSDIVAQPDGKVLVVGRAGSEVGVLRLNSDGSRDTTFDGDGRAIMDLGVGDDRGVSVALDGPKIVVGAQAGGQAYINPGDFAVVRLNPDGSPDLTFAQEGVRVEDGLRSGEDLAKSMAYLPGGSVLVMGSTGSYEPDIGLARFGPDGKLDPSFGSGGRTTYYTGKWGNPQAMAVRDGKIVVVSNGYYRVNIYRFNTDGSIDETFGDKGQTSFGAGGFIYAKAVVVLPDQRVLVAADDGGPNRYLLRFNADGTPDTTFNGTGQLKNPPGVTNSMAVQPDGKIVTVGTAVARFHSNGATDSTFGGGDGFVNMIEFGLKSPEVRSVTVLDDGRIVAGGRATPDGATYGQLALFRLNADGSKDTSFDGDGAAFFDFGMQLQFGTGLAVQEDGRAVLVGHTSDADTNKTDVRALRVNADGSLDPTFGEGGRWTYGSATTPETAAGVLVRPDGRIVVLGTERTEYHRTDVFLYQLQGTPTELTGVRIEPFGPYTVPAGGSVRLLGGADAPGGVLAYEWDFDFDGVRFDADATGDRPVFSAQGLAKGSRRTIALRVTDGRGWRTLDTTTVTVLNGPPRFVRGSVTVTPGATDEGGTVTLTGAIADADVSDPHTLTVTWGDPTNSQVVELQPGQTSFTVTHRYGDDGPTSDPQDIYRIGLTVTDGSATATTRAEALVSNVAPVVDLGPDLTTSEGQTISFSKAVTDPGEDAMTYQWRVIKDGVQLAASTSSTFSYVPREQGVYVVELTARDDDGGSGTDALTLDVQNTPPTITLGGPAGIFPGQSYALTFSATDPGTDSVTGWRVAWGDGTVENFAAAAAGASHVYANAGTFEAVVTASDEDGSYSATRKVLVADRPQLSGGTLTIRGTGGNDSIGGFRTGTQFVVFVNGVSSAYAATAVTRIVVDAGAGDDRVSFGDVAQSTAADVTLGEGDDVFAINATYYGAVTVGGGNGNDLVDADGGSLSLSFDGGGGSDSVEWFGAGSVTITASSITSPSRSLGFTGVEVVSHEGGYQSDVIDVNGVAPGVTLKVLGWDGDDRFNVNAASATAGLFFYGQAGYDSFFVTSALTAATYVSGASETGADSGSDSLTFTGTNAADSFTVTATELRSGFSRISLGDLQYLTLKGGEGDDLATVPSDLLTQVDFQGEGGSDTLAYQGTAAGEWLTVAATGLTGRSRPVNFLTIESLKVEAGDGADWLRVAGTPAGVSVKLDGQAGDDVTTLLGAGPVRIPGVIGNDNLEYAQPAATSVVVEAGATNAGSLRLERTGGAPDLEESLVVEGGKVVLGHALRFASLDLRGDARASVAAGGARTVFARSLSIAAGAELDLNDNDLVLLADAAGRAAALAQAQTLVRIGRDGGAWDGRGLVSSAARQDASKLTGLSVSPSPDGVLVKYTWTGDADGDGRVTADDYFRIDRGFLGRSTGYFAGDFNFDWRVDLDDYSLIDLSYLGQDGVL